MTTTMTTSPTGPAAAAPPRHTGRSILRVYRTEAWQEFLKLIRLPIFAVTTVALPLMFYVIFGVTFAGEQTRGVGVTTYMLVTYGAFGVIGAALFGFGVSVAVERGQGWMRLKRVAPMPPLAYFIAKVVMSLPWPRSSWRACSPSPQRWAECGWTRSSGWQSGWHWSPGRCPSRRWAWRSDTSSGRTRHPLC